MCIYLVYPTPTFCLQKWVEPGRWCRKSGLLRLVSVCLVSSVISWMPKPAAAHVRDLPMCVLAAVPLTRITASDSRKGTCETYLVVCVIRRVKASTTDKSVPVHAMKSLCEQDGRLYAHIKTFILRTSKRAASGPVPRSS